MVVKGVYSKVNYLLKLEIQCGKELLLVNVQARVSGKEVAGRLIPKIDSETKEDTVFYFIKLKEEEIENLSVAFEDINNNVTTVSGIQYDYDEELEFFDIESNLIISRPFLPNEDTVKLNANFLFIAEGYEDLYSLQETCRAYSNVYIERDIAEKFGEAIAEIESKVSVIDNIVKQSRKLDDIRIAFLASSDTHVNFMLKIAENIENHIFLIPGLEFKDDSAASSLDKAGKKYIEIGYHDVECKQLKDFNPQFIFVGADWTSEFIAVQRIIKNTGIRTIALQEGPQDWNFRFKQNIRGEEVIKVLNHYRNADIIFGQGARTFQMIRPKYFSVTGNNKINKVEMCSLPLKPKVLINCNFTYVKTKPAYEGERDVWMQSVLRVCKKLKVDYMISKHPRDDSEWPGEPLIKSNAFKIREQIEACSISISRFSSIPYETVALGRQAIYYNVHMEPMQTFMESQSEVVKTITSENELESFLLEHINSYPKQLKEQECEQYLHKHVGAQDGRAVERIIETIKQAAQNDCDEEALERIGLLPCRLKKADSHTIAVFVRNSATAYSGGRYHALMIAEALASSGNKVYFVTDNYPVFYSDFYKYNGQQNIEVMLTKNFKVRFDFEKLDAIICVPAHDRHTDFYASVVKTAKEHQAPIALINFETPNWFNELSPYPKDEKRWELSNYVAEYAHTIVSSTYESDKYARKYYGEINKELCYKALYPTINILERDAANVRNREKRILVITRFDDSEHKGGKGIADLFCEELSGYTLVVILGNGKIPKDVMDNLEQKGERYGIRIEIKHKISDFEKFVEIKKAAVMIFPSYFEGYGYPPIEAVASGLRCIAFDLPVLRETCGDCIRYAKVGDFESLRKIVIEELAEFEESQSRFKPFEIVDKARLEYFAIGLEELIAEMIASSNMDNPSEIIVNDPPAGEGKEEYLKSALLRLKEKIKKFLSENMSKQHYEKIKKIYKKYLRRTT